MKNNELKEMKQLINNATIDDLPQMIELQKRLSVVKERLLELKVLLENK